MEVLVAAAFAREGMRLSATRVYTWIASIGLFAQGTITLAALLIPAFDRAAPFVLSETQMIPNHSLLHIASGLAGFAALRFGGSSGPRWFSIGFGLFYVGLAISGEFGGQPTCLGLKPFDHPFHAVVGGVGLFAAATEYIRARVATRSNA